MILRHIPICTSNSCILRCMPRIDFWQKSWFYLSLLMRSSSPRDSWLLSSTFLSISFSTVDSWPNRFCLAYSLLRARNNSTDSFSLRTLSHSSDRICRCLSSRASNSSSCCTFVNRLLRVSAFSSLRKKLPLLTSNTLINKINCGKTDPITSAIVAIQPT
jgi:hypothetical protein